MDTSGWRFSEGFETVNKLCVVCSCTWPNLFPPEFAFYGIMHRLPRLDPSLSFKSRVHIWLSNAANLMKYIANATKNIPVYVVSDEGDVEEEGEELSGDEEEGVEEDVQDVLWEDERVEAVALVDRVLVVRLQLVESDDLWKISI